MNQAESLVIINNKLDGIWSIGIQLFFSDCWIDYPNVGMSYQIVEAFLNEACGSLSPRRSVTIVPHCAISTSRNPIPNPASQYINYLARHAYILRC